MAPNPLTTSTRLALDIFLMDGQARNLSPSTIRGYRQQITWFTDFLALQHCHDLDAITPHHIRTYLFHLQTERNWRPASVHAAARSIRAFLNFSHAEELLATNPMARVKMPKVNDAPLPAFSPEEIHTLLAAVHTQRDKALLLCLLDTGCRAREILAWNVGDVNLPAGTVRVRQTKNGKERTVYLGVRARRELMKLLGGQSLASDEPVWRNLHTGARFQYDGLKTLMRDLGDATGVKPCGAHRFRRTFALLSLRNGMNIFALQRIMGHADLTILQRYLALLDEDLQAAHRQFGAVDNLRR